MSVHRSVPCYIRKTNVAVVEGRKSSKDIIINDAMSNDEVVVHDVPLRLLLRCTLGQNQVVLGHLIINFPTSEGVSERTDEHSGARERRAERVAPYIRPISWLICTTALSQANASSGTRQSPHGPMRSFKH